MTEQISDILAKHPLPWNIKSKLLPMGKWTYYEALEIYDKNDYVVYDCNTESHKKERELLDILNYVSRIKDE